MEKNSLKVIFYATDKITKISFFTFLTVFSFYSIFITDNLTHHTATRKFFQFLFTLFVTVKEENFQPKSLKKLFFCTECIFARALIAIQKLTERARERAFRSKIK
jgi:hypothetical protein